MHLLIAILSTMVMALWSTPGVGADISRESGQEEQNEYDGFVPSVVQDDEDESPEEGDANDGLMDRQARTRYLVIGRRTSEQPTERRVIRGSIGARRNNAYLPPPTWPDSADGAGGSAASEPSADRSLTSLIANTNDHQATRLCGLRLTQKSREVCKDCIPHNLAAVALIEKRGDGMSSSLGRYIAPEKLTQKCCLRKCTVEDIRAVCCGSTDY